jgi:hypothetical protein
LVGKESAVRTLKDFQGRIIRLTDERLRHILEHPEMSDMADAIEETLAQPEKVIQSLSDPEAELYYRFYFGTRVEDKYLCVVVKVRRADAFILTAYLTDTMKKGDAIWPKK